jgi:hypothetical protein
MNRLKLAELTSGIGALVLGIGLGARFPQWFGGAAGFIVLIGAITHGFGMWDKHRMEGHGHAQQIPVWVSALYWACWLLVAGVLVFLFVRRG